MNDKSLTPMLIIALLILLPLIILVREEGFESGYLLGYSDAKAGFVNQYRTKEPDHEG